MLIEEQNTNKKIKTIAFCQSGITSTVKHLCKNLQDLMPHIKKESKFGSESLVNIKEVMDLRNANRCLFFQVKKRRDSYLWISSSPQGPTFKFLIENIETLTQDFPGNCLAGAGSIFTFSPQFETDPNLIMLKNILLDIFQPSNFKTTEYIDKIISFYWYDDRVWFRAYNTNSSNNFDLLEIGPRFTLNLISIFEGVFSGKITYKNAKFLPPSRHVKIVTKQAEKRVKNRIQKRVFQAEAIQNRPVIIDEIDQAFRSNT